ncbi:glycosyltransferase [Brumimicrobium oceani]|uniref:Glycosyltransferase n=1 Tax=Brumimicrobium oceani TaxID=2100725 RepID=A0A2U2XGN7_9FLAO|nr:glycosyltransferase [Brumimicrobium oceani]PWH86969.1 hypothetical protein DIT68_01545 [Brumimicrobium oceani]
MEIVQIIRNFATGGAERFAIDLSNRLYLDGHKVTIIRFFDDADQNILESEINEGVKIVTIQKKPGFDFSLIFRVHKFLKKLKPDIVHTHLNAFNYCFLSYFISRKTKYFHTLHSMPVNEAINKVDLSIKKLIFKSGIVNPISISDEVHQESLMLYGSKVHLIYNGRVEPKRSNLFPEVNELVKKIETKDNIPVIINIGSFKEAKNQKMLIEAINEINENGTKVKLIVLGNPASGKDYDRMTKLANLEHIHFLGMVNNPTDYMFAADFFCLSSLWEGMPISLIEAFATHCLAISTPAGGVKSMIKDGFNGLITTDFDKENLKLKIIEALELSVDSKRKIEENAFTEFISKFSIEQCAVEHTKLYESKCS